MGGLFLMSEDLLTRSELEDKLMFGGEGQEV
jgi:hypothetical protein